MEVYGFGDKTTPDDRIWQDVYWPKTPAGDVYLRLTSLSEGPVSKCGAGYQPAAALWAAIVFNTEKPAGSRLPAE
jgi:hypothetical protein